MKLNLRLFASFAPTVPAAVATFTVGAAASGTKMTHNAALAALSNAGITVHSSGDCSDRNSRNCTSLEQINSGTIDGIVGFKRASGCEVMVTGGTEVGHASGTYSHWNGFKLDIHKSACVDEYITGRFTYAGVRADHAQMYTDTGRNVYADEGDHWDILYY